MSNLLWCLPKLYSASPLKEKYSNFAAKIRTFYFLCEGKRLTRSLMDGWRYQVHGLYHGIVWRRVLSVRFLYIGSSQFHHQMARVAPSRLIQYVWPVGLGVWFLLWVQEVPGSNPGRARNFFFQLKLLS